MTRLYDENMELKEKLREILSENGSLKEKYKILDNHHMEKDYAMQQLEKSRLIR